MFCVSHDIIWGSSLTSTRRPVAITGETRQAPRGVGRPPCLGSWAHCSVAPFAGHHGLLQWNSALGQAAYETHPTLHAVSVEALQHGFEHKVDVNYIGGKTSAVVVGQEEPPNRSPTSQTTSPVDAQDRYVHQLGLRGFIVCSRPVAHGGETPTHQLARAHGSLAVPAVFSGPGC